MFHCHCYLTAPICKCLDSFIFMWILNKIYLPLHRQFKGPSLAATRKCVLSYTWESWEDSFIFQAVSSQGMPAPYNSITYHTVLSAMFYYSVIFSRVGSTWGWKSQALLLAQADGFIIGNNVDYTISNERILFKYAHGAVPPDECSTTASISTARSAVGAILVAQHLTWSSRCYSLILKQQHVFFQPSTQ